MNAKRIRRSRIIAVSAALVASAGVAGAVIASAGADDGQPTPSDSPALSAASPYVRSALERAGGTVDLGQLEALGMTPTSEALYRAPSVDAHMVCFLVVEPPDAKPLPGTSIACGLPAVVVAKGQQIWRDNSDGSVSLWLLAPEGADRTGRATLRVGARSLEATASGVISTEVPPGITRVELMGPGESEPLTVPGR